MSHTNDPPTRTSRTRVQAQRAQQASALGHLGHRGRVTTRGKLVELRSCWAGAVFELLVDPVTHRIAQAAFDGSVSTTTAAVFERLCASIEGMSVHQANDPTVLRARPTPTPAAENLVDPAYALPMRLARDTMSLYTQR